MSHAYYIFSPIKKTRNFAYWGNANPHILGTYPLIKSIKSNVFLKSIKSY